MCCVIVVRRISSATYISITYVAINIRIRERRKEEEEGGEKVRGGQIGRVMNV